MTTYSASSNCADSATPTCSGDVCLTMSSGGGSLTPDGAYNSLWDSVPPRGNHSTVNPTAKVYNEKADYLCDVEYSGEYKR